MKTPDDFTREQWLEIARSAHDQARVLVVGGHNALVRSPSCVWSEDAVGRAPQPALPLAALPHELRARSRSPRHD